MLRIATFLAVICLSTAAMAVEPFILVQYSSADQPGAISINWMSLFQDPMVLSALVMAGLLFLSKVMKLDLTKLGPVIMALLNGILKPPSTPTVPATPAPATPAVPASPTVDLLQLLVQLLTDAKTKGDREGEEAVLSVLKRIK